MLESDFNLSQKLAKTLINKKFKIAAAESCTGGGLAYALTSIPGSSAWFERGFVVYSNGAKMDLLGVPSQTLLQYGAVSEETAVEMAKGALLHSLADIAVSTTGIAGPDGGSVEKPVGTVWLGLASRHKPAAAKLIQLRGSRQQIRQETITLVIQWVLQEVSDM